MLDYHILTVGYGTANATGAGQLFEIFDGEKFCRLPPLRPKVMDVLKCEWDRQGPFGAGPRKGGDLRCAEPLSSALPLPTVLLLVRL